MSNKMRTHIREGKGGRRERGGGGGGGVRRSGVRPANNCGGQIDGGETVLCEVRALQTSWHLLLRREKVFLLLLRAAFVRRKRRME